MANKRILIIVCSYVFTRSKLVFTSCLPADCQAPSVLLRVLFSYNAETRANFVVVGLKVLDILTARHVHQAPHLPTNVRVETSDPVGQDTNLYDITVPPKAAFIFRMLSHGRCVTCLGTHVTAQAVPRWSSDLSALIK